MRPDRVQAVVEYSRLGKRSVSPDSATHHSLQTMSGAQWLMLELEKLKVWIYTCKNLWICYLTTKNAQHMGGLNERW
jgi:hypothetical protein